MSEPTDLIAWARAIAAERDAAVRERDEARVQLATQKRLTLALVRDARDDGRAEIAELDSVLTKTRTRLSQVEAERDAAIADREQMVQLRKRDVRIIGSLETALDAAREMRANTLMCDARRAFDSCLDSLANIATTEPQ